VRHAVDARHPWRDLLGKVFGVLRIRLVLYAKYVKLIIDRMIYMKTRLNHVRVNVSDINKALKWYEEILGFESDGGWPLDNPTYYDFISCVNISSVKP